jgi:bifunctional NMN adenylyltransferase/nudix hydrolase
MKTTENNAEVGVIVARFQSPILHEGHREILDAVRSYHTRVIVFLGLSPLKCTINNPYDFGIRKAMIEEVYHDVEVLYIDDIGHNELWSKNLDRQIAKTVGPGLKVVLYGSRDSFINSYTGHYPTIELVPSKYISASEIRKRTGIKPKTTQDFREGIVYAVQNQFPSFKATVDLAIIDHNKRRLLLAQKPNQDLLQFVGGFTDVFKDKSAEDTARREGKEETGLELLLEGYVGSALIDDWRYRREQDKILTFFYVMRYQGGEPVAKDDIRYVAWKNFGELNEGELMPMHRPLLSMLNDYFKNEILRLP